MKYFIIIFFISSNIFSQKVIVPVEEKANHLTNNSNIRNYEFRDVNDVFEKFTGKWIYRDSINEIKIDVNTFYDEVNQQDAVYVKMLFIKSSDTIINTLNLKKPNFSFIKGGSFYKNSDFKTTIIYLQDIAGNLKRKILVCGTSNSLDLTYVEPNKLKWQIIQKRGQLRSKTTNLFPGLIEFTKLED